MQYVSLGLGLIQAGLLVSVVLIAREVALRYVHMDEVPLVCRRRIEQRNPLCRPILALALMVTLAGVVMIGVG